MSKQIKKFDAKALMEKAYSDDTSGLQVFESDKLPVVKVTMLLSVGFWFGGLIVIALVVLLLWWSGVIAVITWGLVWAVMLKWIWFLPIGFAGFFVSSFFAAREEAHRRLIVADGGIVYCERLGEVFWSFDFEGVKQVSVLIDSNDTALVVVQKGVRSDVFAISGSFRDSLFAVEEAFSNYLEKSKAK